MLVTQIEADVPELEHAGDLRQQQHLHEQALQVGEKGLAKGCQRIVVGVQVASDKAEW